MSLLAKFFKESDTQLGFSIRTTTWLLCSAI